MDKKTILTCACATTLLVACSSRTPYSIKNTFGDNALVEQIVNGGERPSMDFVYNQDTLVAIALWDEYNYWEPTTFEYGDIAFEGTKYDVRMTCGSGAMGMEAIPTDFYFTLGDNGFASTALQVDRHDDGEVTRSQWRFGYTDDGYLASYTHSSGQYEDVGTLTWTDGDLTLAERRSTVGASTVYDKVALYYISSQEANPIANRGCVNIYDGTYGVDMYSVINSAYYAALLGRATVHLPLMAVRGEGSAAARTNFVWQYNGDGYPVVLDVASPVDAQDQTVRYGWRGFAPMADSQEQAVQEALDDIYARALTNSERDPQANLALMTATLRQACEQAEAAAQSTGQAWIDINPWVDSAECSQPSLKSTQIMSCAADQALARVEVYPVSSAPEEVHAVNVALERTPEGWRVADIIASDGVSLLNMAVSYAVEK